MDTEEFAEKYAIPFTLLDGVVPACIANVSRSDWLRIAELVKTEGGRLITIWGTDRRPLEDHYAVSVVFCAAEGLLWLRLTVAEGESYPDLSTLFPAAARMQRTIFELIGIAATDAEDIRHWLNHGKWPNDYFPLRSNCTGREKFSSPLEPYPFVTVTGDGVHEIAVGPVHAGVIEPGHFRFSVVGEKVLRLEQQLGYTHKGIDKLLIGRSIADGVRIAGRVSGDSTVAFAWAYCMAVESIRGCQVPQRAEWLRALLLERERIANHLGDLGALGNDAGLAIGLSQFMRLKEDWVRLSHQLFGHRFMMDLVIPGGVTIDLDRSDIDLLSEQLNQIENEVSVLRSIYDEHAGLQDRFISAGRVLPKLAADLGLCGLAGRASGQAFDVRADHKISPYDKFNVRMATHRNGDVAARVMVRFEEISESIRLLRQVLLQLPAGDTVVKLNGAVSGQFGVGWIEGWRGAILVAVETDARGSIMRCHCHDPSWQNWPVLQHAILGNIVPDFPLINKSFNLSYAGQDL